MKNVRQDKNLPWACLLGDVSMVRALGRTGIPVAIATTDRSDKCTRSRFCNDVIPIPGWQHDPQETLSALTRWAATRDTKPVLFYQTDLDVVWLSRFRDRLSKSFRFVLPDGQLVEDLVDKARFYEQLRIGASQFRKLEYSTTRIVSRLNAPIGIHFRPF